MQKLMHPKGNGIYSYQEISRSVQVHNMISVILLLHMRTDLNISISLQKNETCMCFRKLLHTMWTENYVYVWYSRHYKYVMQWNIQGSSLGLFSPLVIKHLRKILIFFHLIAVRHVTGVTDRTWLTTWLSTNNFIKGTTNL